MSVSYFILYIILELSILEVYMKVLSYCHIKPLFAFCTGCGATLEFVRREAKMSKIHLVNGTQNDGKDYYIICPVCGKIIYENTWKNQVEAL